MTTVGKKMFKRYALKITRTKFINLHLFRIKYGGEAILRPPPPPPKAKEEQSAYMFQKFLPQKKADEERSAYMFQQFCHRNKKGGRGAERLHVSAILSYIALDVVLVCDRRFILHPVPTVCIAIEGM